MLDYFKHTWIFTLIWLISIIAVFASYSEAKAKHKPFHWVAFAISFLTFVLLPIDRYTSDRGVDHELSDLKEKLRISKDLIESQSKAVTTLAQQNELLGQQVSLLNIYRKSILRIGFRIEATFSIAGFQDRQPGTAIPYQSPVYGMMLGRGKVPLHSQDGFYILAPIEINKDSTTYFFSTNVEVLNSEYPVGEKLDSLKVFQYIYLFIPFVTRNSMMGTLVVMKNIKLTMTLNGRKIQDYAEAKNITSVISNHHYYSNDDQKFWIEVPVKMQSDIYQQFNLSRF